MVALDISQSLLCGARGEKLPRGDGRVHGWVQLDLSTSTSPLFDMHTQAWACVEAAANQAVMLLGKARSRLSTPPLCTGMGLR